MSDLYLVNLSGRDRPGLTAQVLAILAGHDVSVLDVGQSVIHDTLSLALLVDVDEADDGVLRDLVVHTSRLDIDLRLTPVTAQEYAAWVARQHRDRYIVTLLARQLHAGHLAAVAQIVSEGGLAIDDMTRLSERQPLGDASRRACVQLRVVGEVKSLEQMRERFLGATADLDIDVAFQRDDIFRRHRRVVVLDMDSTLVQGEIIDELAVEAGVGEQVAAITASAMQGEIDFHTSFERRLALLEGLSADRLDEVAERVPLTDGAQRLISTLKRLGYHVAILSGGFTYFARHLQQQLGIDEVHANELEILDGRVTGRVSGRVVDGERKGELLRQIASREGVALEQVVAVGDGANDLPMLRLAGLGIAFRAKPLVRREARHALSTVGLDGILYLMGIHDRELSAT